jgi:hypothetical protein
MARFEVLALDQDRELIRSLARRLVANGPDASEIRASMLQSVKGEKRGRGGVLAALRRSPLVGTDLKLTRPVSDGRKVDL